MLSGVVQTRMWLVKVFNTVILMKLRDFRRLGLMLLIFCRWRQTRLLVSWVLLSHGWRTRCPTRSVRWLARWPRPHPCRPLLPPPPPLCPRLASPHPRRPSSVLMMWSYLPSSRSRTGKLLVRTDSCLISGCVAQDGLYWTILWDSLWCSYRGVENTVWLVWRQLEELVFGHWDLTETQS